MEMRGRVCDDGGFWREMGGKRLLRGYSRRAGGYMRWCYEAIFGGVDGFGGGSGGECVWGGD